MALLGASPIGLGNRQNRSGNPRSGGSSAGANRLSQRGGLGTTGGLAGRGPLVQSGAAGTNYQNYATINPLAQDRWGPASYLGKGLFTFGRRKGFVDLRRRGQKRNLYKRAKLRRGVAKQSGHSANVTGGMIRTSEGLKALNQAQSTPFALRMGAQKGRG